MFFELQVTPNCPLIHVNPSPKRPTTGPYTFWAMETHFADPTCKLLAHSGMRGGPGMATDGRKDFLNTGNNWYGNAVTLAIQGLMQTALHANNNDASLTEESSVTIGGPIFHRG